MEFTFDFDWKKSVLQFSFHRDEAAVVPAATSRVGFHGLIGTESQTGKDLNLDMSQERKDFGDIKFARDENGRIKGRAVITTIGVYPYIRKDGTVEWELRHPDDVYDYESLKTLELLPLTNDHPTEIVTKDNVQSLQVGQFGEFVMIDTFHGFVTNTVVVSESAAVADVEAGKRALSMGYKCDVMAESGNWNGIPYTARQKNIRYNHGSIVEKGRAGDDAVMKFDSFEGIETIKENITVINTDVNTDKGVTMGDENLKSVKLDGVDYKAEPAVIAALHKANEKLDAVKDLPTEIATLKNDKAALEGERDALKEKTDTLQKELDSSIKTDQLEGLFQKRQKLDEAVALAKIEDSEKMDVKEKMSAVVIAVTPNAKEALEARKDSAEFGVYLESRFDAALETLKKDETVLLGNLQSASGVSTKKTDEEDKSELKTDEDVWKALVHASDKKGA